MTEAVVTTVSKDAYKLALVTCVLKSSDKIISLDDIRFYHSEIDYLRYNCVNLIIDHELRIVVSFDKLLKELRINKNNDITMELTLIIPSNYTNKNIKRVALDIISLINLRLTHPLFIGKLVIHNNKITNLNKKTLEFYDIETLDLDKYNKLIPNKINKINKVINGVSFKYDYFLTFDN